MGGWVARNGRPGTKSPARGPGARQVVSFSPERQEARLASGLLCLLLLLALGVGLLAFPPGILRMLLGVARVFLALRVIAFAMMFGCGPMGLGGIFVMFRRLVVFVFGHVFPPVKLLFA
jgi:hypothetical protein